MSKKLVLFFLCFSLFLSMPSCKKKLPTSPDILAVITQSITVTSSSDLLYIGISETFTATATMSDGSTKAVIGGVWSGNNSIVATVEATTGLVTIVGSGTVSISVTYGGKTGSKSIRGLPNYQGTWSGTYRIDSCSATGDFFAAGFCYLVPSGTVAPTDLVLTQVGDQVTGRFYLGDLSADAVGPVQTNGQLTLTGKVEGDITIDTVYQLQSTIPGQITGELTQLWLGLGQGWSGQGLFTCTIISISRTSTMTMAPPPRRATVDDSDAPRSNPRVAQAMKEQVIIS